MASATFCPLKRPFCRYRGMNLTVVRDGRKVRHVIVSRFGNNNKGGFDYEKANSENKSHRIDGYIKRPAPDHGIHASRIS